MRHLDSLDLKKIIRKIDDYSNSREYKSKTVTNTLDQATFKKLKGERERIQTAWGCRQMTGESQFNTPVDDDYSPVIPRVATNSTNRSNHEQKSFAKVIVPQMARRPGSRLLNQTDLKAKYLTTRMGNSN